jgi:hypothetical protein
MYASVAVKTDSLKHVAFVYPYHIIIIESYDNHMHTVDAIITVILYKNSCMQIEFTYNWNTLSLLIVYY